MGRGSTSALRPSVVRGRALVSVLFGLLTALLLAELVGVFGPRECPIGSLVCSSTGLTIPALVTFVVSWPVPTWAAWRWTGVRSRWGEVSLLAAVASPSWFFLPIFLDDAIDASATLEALLRIGLIVGAPAAGLMAIVAGHRSRRRAKESLSGRIGFVFGWIEIVLYGLLVLFLWAMQDALNEPI